MDLSWASVDGRTEKCSACVRHLPKVIITRFLSPLTASSGVRGMWAGVRWECPWQSHYSSADSLPRAGPGHLVSSAGCKHEVTLNSQPPPSTICGRQDFNPKSFFGYLPCWAVVYHCVCSFFNLSPIILKYIVHDDWVCPYIKPEKNSCKSYSYYLQHTLFYSRLLKKGKKGWWWSTKLILWLTSGPWPVVWKSLS